MTDFRNVIQKSLNDQKVAQGKFCVLKGKTKATQTKKKQTIWNNLTNVDAALYCTKDDNINKFSAISYEILYNLVTLTQSKR